MGSTKSSKGGDLWRRPGRRDRKAVVPTTMLRSEVRNPLSEVTCGEAQVEAIARRSCW